MSKITLSSVGTLIDATTAANAINNNFSTIQTAFDDTLSRDGTTPNVMGAALDMDSNRILNLPAPTSPTDPIRLQDLSSVSSGGAGFGANTYAGTQTILPPTGTITKGLSITQTGPSSGTTTGPILFNNIDVTNPGLSAGGTGTWDAFGIRNLIYSLRSTMSVTGTSAGAGSGALAGITNISGASDGIGGVHGITITGTSPAGHNAWGGLGYAIGFSNSSIGLLIGLEGEIGISSSASANIRVAVSANSQGPTQGSVLDAAFAANVSTGNIPGSTGSSAKFQHLMALSNAMYGGGFPLATTGDFFFSDIAGTVANFANLSNVTVTGNILSFPSVVISGSGGATFGVGGSPTAGQLFVSQASGGQILTQAALNTTSGVSSVAIYDTSRNNILVAGVGEAANTVVRFGQTLGNYAELISTGTSNVGMLLGTVGSTTLVIGTNNTARMIVSAAGNIGIGPQAPKTLMDINANAASPTLVVSTSLARLQAVDGSLGGMEFVSYGTVPGNILAGAIAGGTAASPTATPSQKNMFNLRGYGWNGTSWQIGSIITLHAVNTWSGSDQSSQIDFYTTPTGSTTIAVGMTIMPSGGLAVGTATDPGIGNVIATEYKSTTAPTTVAGAGPVAIGSASAINSRMKVNLNGTDYWIPCSTTAF